MALSAELLQRVALGAQAVGLERTHPCVFQGEAIGMGHFDPVAVEARDAAAFAVATQTSRVAHFLDTSTVNRLPLRRVRRGFLASVALQTEGLLMTGRTHRRILSGNRLVKARLPSCRMRDFHLVAGSAELLRVALPTPGSR